MPEDEVIAEIEKKLKEESKLDKLLKMMEEERREKYRKETEDFYKWRNERPSCGLT